MHWLVKRLGRLPALALLLAVGYSAILIAGAFVVPVYQSSGASSSGDVTTGTGTLAGVNGMGAVAVIGVPLLVTLAVGGALLLRPRRGAAAAGWAFAGLLAAFNLLAMLSIGVFVLPVTAGLIVACAAHRPHPVRRLPISGR